MCPRMSQSWHLLHLMFLFDLQGSGLNDCDAVDSGSLNRQVRYRQRMKENLRRWFRKEYVGQLFLATEKKGRKLQPREVVLLAVENSKKLEWSLAVVEELIPGRDGEVWLVKLRTTSGILLRPIQRV